MIRQMQIPVTLPSSPKKDNARNINNIDIPAADDSCFGAPDATPAAQRELYRTCFPDELRRSPVDGSTLENDRTLLVNRSVQAFNTPFPVKVIGEVVRVIAALDENSQQSDSSVSVPPPRPAPLSEFRLAVLEPPTSFHDSQIPMLGNSSEVPPEATANQNGILPASAPVATEEDLAKKVGIAEDEQSGPPPQSPTLPPAYSANDVEQVEQNTRALPPPPPLINVEYTSWSLLPTKKFSGFFVDGKNIATGVRANSSRIVERLDFHIVKSASGAVIRLLGPPDEKRMLQFYISRSLISLFSKGFPTDWMVLVESEMGRLKNASEGIKKRILGLLEDLTNVHQPMSHSRDISLASASLISSQTSEKASAARSRSKTVSKKDAGQRTDPDKTFKLPPIVETPDSEEPRLGPHHFPIETFSPKNDTDFVEPQDNEESSPEEEEEDAVEAREEDDLESSASIVESTDLSEVDDRQHYQRRRARQGNKAAKQKSSARSNKKAPEKPKASRESNAAKKSRGGVSKPATVSQVVKSTVKKAGKTQQKVTEAKEVVIATVAKRITVRKMDLAKNSLITSSQKSENASLSTDLNIVPDSSSKTRSGAKRNVDELPLPFEIKSKGNVAEKPAAGLKSPSNSTLDLPSSSQQNELITKNRTRKRKPSPAPPPPPTVKAPETVQQKKPQEQQKTNLRHKKQTEVAVESEKSKPARVPTKRPSQEPEPEQLGSVSKRAKKAAESAEKEEEPVKPARTTRSGKQAVADKTSVVLVEKLSAEECGPKTRGRSRKVVEEVEPQVQPSPPKPIAKRGKVGKTVQKQQRVSTEEDKRPKNDEYEFLPESPPKKATVAKKPASNHGGSRKKKQQPSIKESGSKQQSQSASPSRQPNPLKSAPIPPSGSGAARAWSDGEIERLKRAIIQVSTSAPDYWKAVSNLVATRSEEDCFAMYNKRMDIQKATHCNLMMSKLLPDADTSMNCSPLSPEKPAAKSRAKPAPKKPEAAQTKGGKKTVTAGVGTLKRREQIRAIVQEEAAEEWFSATGNVNDAASHRGGGLTQSERAALIGNNMALITPSAGVGSSSMVTAGGQALSGLDSEGPASSMISSALEMPASNKNRQEADKLVQKMRGNGGGASKQGATKAAPAGQTLRKKAMVLDHLSPMAGKLRGFLPKNMSTPQIPAGMRHRDDEYDEEDDTLPESPSTLTDGNKRKNPISPIFRR